MIALAVGAVIGNKLGGDENSVLVYAFLMIFIFMLANPLEMKLNIPHC